MSSVATPPSADTTAARPVQGSGTSLAHVPALDGVRAIAVLMVIYYHWIRSGSGGLSGTIGVRLFFVLSGLLITRILLVARHNEGALAGKLKTFYTRRTLRIFPLYYAMLVVSALTSAMFRPLWPWYVTYLQNIAMVRQGQWLFAAHFWTLAIEEQFYLVWPILILTIPWRAIPALLAAVALAAPAWRIVAHSLLGLNDVQVSLFTLASVDSLAMGAILAWLAFNGRSPSNRLLALAGAMGIYIGIIHFMGGNQLFSLTLLDSGVALAAFAVVGFVDRNPRGVVSSLLAARPLVYIGRISYGIYVYHFFVPSHLGRIGRFLEKTGGRPLFLLGALTVTLLVSSLSWRFFENPLNRLKERLAPAGRTRR